MRYHPDVSMTRCDDDLGGILWTTCGFFITHVFFLHPRCFRILGAHLFPFLSEIVGALSLFTVRNACLSKPYLPQCSLTRSSGRWRTKADFSVERAARMGQYGLSW
ncbi:hypothetical protein C8R43DRAFT_967287 [Mycena crocata]|nr:hypothetical protein C8R43DRAFT_967287 [Mycena crocata]